MEPAADIVSECGTALTIKHQLPGVCKVCAKVSHGGMQSKAACLSWGNIPVIKFDSGCSNTVIVFCLAAAKFSCENN